MKKLFRLLSLVLAVCIVAPWLSQAGLAAEGGTTHTVSDRESVSALLAQDKVKDGDTIRITGDGYAQAPGADPLDTPWVIDKSVTITGGCLDIFTGGIVLGADVTFKDTNLFFTSNVRNAIMANGHTLTLENTACGNHSFNLFCGGLINSNNEQFSDEIPAPGKVGTIHIKGSTTLQNKDTWGSGSIYAGNLCMGGMNESNNGPDKNGPANVFDGSAVITIEDCDSGRLGTVYACGAQQRIPVGAPNGKVTLPDAARYTVSGSVTVSGKVPDVEGAGSGETHVAYEDNGNGYMVSCAFSGLSSLSVNKGNLELKAESYNLDGVAVSVASGAKLNLAALAGRIPTFGSFTGGGFLILHQNQTLPISGAVTGTASVAIGGLSFNHANSTVFPVTGHTYIASPNSRDGAFQLLPYASRPDMALVRDSGGNWAVPAKTEETSKLQSLAPENIRVDSGKTEILVPLNTTYSGEALGIDTLPLTIRINGKEASFHAEDAYYEAAGLHLYVGDTRDGDELQIYAAASFDDPIPDNVYRIGIVVPGEYTAAGADLTASFTLTVGDVAPEPVSVPIPQANPGLVWTGEEQTGVNEGMGYTLTGHRAVNAGSYTATATLESGCRWEDGSGENKVIPWSIAKAAAPAAPAGLAGAAPSSADGTDGKITGTTAGMEYSADSDFSAPQSCGEGETTGLAAGTYYVRVKGSGNRVPGESVQVTVPAYAAPAPEHQHSWSGDWSVNKTHHWHNCAGENCPIRDDSEKDGYAAHTPGDWVIDQAPTATQSGSRHRSCSVCGYEMEREVIPATGGGSSDDNPPDDSSSSSGTSSGWSAPTNTVRNPDGSTTTVKTSRRTGTVTETTKRPDGSKTVVETQKDGTVTTTDTAKDGSTVTVVAHPGGPVETTVKRADGFTASLHAHQDGTQAEVWLPSKTAQASAGSAAVALPIPALPGNGAELSIHTESPLPVRVEIPVEGSAVTTVACFVERDGRERIIKTAAVDGGKLTLSVPDEAVVRFRDGSKSFDDTGSHWAEDAIRFVTARELFLGQTGSTFGPDGSMTRAMLMVVLARLDGVNAAGETAYGDGMSWAVAKGVSDGREPEEQVTREQFITMLYRYAGSPAVTTEKLSFHDEAAISGYARDAVCWAVENGILNGFEDGSFLPQGHATRAQAAAVLVRYVDYLNQL